MNNSTSWIKDFSLQLPIASSINKIAQQFASQQPTPRKSEQVRLNTLAVCVVNDYLQMMGISTDIIASDSWNPVLQVCTDVADLQVTGLGRLECRPMRSHEQSCYIPPEVWEDRIGYVVVEIDESLREATVLGFAQMTMTEQLLLEQLKPLEDFFDYLHTLAQSIEITASLQSISDRHIVNLRLWFENVCETGWQTVETLFNQAELNPAFNFRKNDIIATTDFKHLEGSIRRAKLLDLGMQLVGHDLALIVEIRPESERKTEILLQVHPHGNQIYLPHLLKLIVIDEKGETFLEAQARRADNYIQLQFRGQLGERFSVKIALGVVSITENFML